MNASFCVYPPRHLLVLLSCLFPAFFLSGQAPSPSLVQDLKTRSPQFDPNRLNNDSYSAQLGNLVFFVEDDARYGRELYVTDGSFAGTRMVADIYPGARSSSPIHLVSLGNYVYFLANDGQSGVELFRSDGSPDGTELVADLIPDYSSFVGPENLSVAGDRIYLSTDNNRLLWSYHPATNQTQLVVDLTSGIIPQRISGPVQNDTGKAFFTTVALFTTSDRFRRLWETEGTAITTRQRGIIPVADPTEQFFDRLDLVVTGEEAYLFYRLFQNGSLSTTVGNYIYRSGNDPAALTLVKAWVGNSFDPRFRSFRGVGNRVVFLNERTADLWVTDGTDAGTQVLSNTNLTPFTQAQIIELPDRLVYLIRENGSGVALWATDGTPAGTTEIQRLALPPSGNRISLGANGGTGYFVISPAFNLSGELWRTDGTSAGTQTTGNFLTPVNFDQATYYLPDGRLLYSTNAAPQGIANRWSFDPSTGQIESLVGDWAGYDADAQIRGPFLSSDQLSFRADAGNGAAQWALAASDQIAQVATGWQPPVDRAQYQTVWRGQAYYSSGEAIYRYDGTSSALVFPSSRTEEVIEFQQQLYFTDKPTDNYPYFGTTRLNVAADNSGFSQVSIDAGGWNIDDITDLRRVGNNLYFLTEESIFTPGPSLGCCFTFRSGAYRFDGNQVFPLEYWQHPDGSPSLLGRAYGDGLYRQAAALGGALIFTDHERLYRTGSGSDAITTLRELPIVDYFNFQYLSTVGDRVYCAVNDGNIGYEILTTDGTTGGTQLLRDIVPGVAGSCPKYAVEADGKAYFLIDHCRKAYELWESDGTTAGTRLHTDLSDFIDIQDSLYFFDGALYFVGNQGQSGLEWWRIPLGVNPPNNGPDLSLSLVVNNTTPPAFSNVNFELRIRNTGDAPMTDILVDFPIPADLAFVIQNVSQGDYFNWVGEWNVGALDPGAEATLYVRLFTLSAGAIPVYAQVAAHRENDVDSSPGNGTPPSVQEDDEVVIILNGGQSPCTISAIQTLLTCDDQGTANPDDDTYTLQVDPQGTSLGQTYTLTATALEPGGPNFNLNSLPYGQAQSSLPFLISSGGFELIIEDDQGACTASETILPPAPCSVGNTLPDLVVDFGPNVPSEIIKETAVPIPFVYQNVGAPTTASLSNEVYLSIDPNISADDLRISPANYPFSLAGTNQVYQDQPSLLLADVFPEGVYWLIVRVDDLNDLTESDETNNTVQRLVQVKSADDPLTCTNNLLRNPGYEAASPLAHWQNLGGAQVSSDANGGNNAVVLNGTGAGSILQNLPAEAGRSYTLSAFAKTTGAPPKAYLSLKFLSASWQPLVTLVEFVPQGSIFERVEINFTAPVGTAFVEARALKETGDFELTVDDWCLTDGPGDPCQPDQIAPVISNCPADITVSTDQNGTTVDWPLPSATDNCGLAIFIPNFLPGLFEFPLGTTTVVYRALDFGGNESFCDFDVTVVSSDTLDNGGVDLELAMTASLTEFHPWQPFSVTLTVNNRGDAPATDVRIEFPQPDGSVFQGGNEFSASQGTYVPYGARVWEVGEVGPNGAASITFNLFTVQASSDILPYAQVIGLNEMDSDSSPGNGTCCTGVEDDELGVVLVPSGSAPNLRQGAVSSLALQQLFPNPASDRLTVLWESPQAGDFPLTVYDVRGVAVLQKTLRTGVGLNSVEVDLAGLPAGMYVIHLADAHPKKAQLRFVKMGM
ncbi:MAG: HYR domain-containing protein [Bacteroidota bacterium]